MSNNVTQQTHQNNKSLKIVVSDTSQEEETVRTEIDAQLSILPEKV